MTHKGWYAIKQSNQIILLLQKHLLISTKYCLEASVGVPHKFSI